MDNKRWYTREMDHIGCCTSLLLSRFQLSKEKSQKVTDLIAVSLFKISLKGEAHIGKTTLKTHSNIPVTYLGA